MATVEKRGNSYRITVSNGYGVDGKQKKYYKTFKPTPNMTQRQIEKELTRVKVLFEEEVKSGKYTERTVKFQVLAEEWFTREEKYGSLKPRSLQRLRGCSQRVYEAIGHLYIHKITTRTIQQFIYNLAEDGINKRTGGGLSTKSQKHHLNLISNVFKYAIKCGIVTDNPCRNVDVVNMPKEERKMFTIEEAQRFLNALMTKAPPKYKMFFLLAVYGGFRKGEILGFEWKDIDFNNDVITVNRISLYYDGKMNVGTPKSEKSKRCVTMSNNIMVELKRYKSYQAQEILKVGDKWQSTDRLFTTWNGEPMNGNTPLTWLHRFCKENNLPQVNVHSLRHLYASILISNGTDVRTTADLLGHEQTSTTLDIYAQSFAKQRAKANLAVANSFNLINSTEKMA